MTELDDIDPFSLPGSLAVAPPPAWTYRDYQDNCCASIDSAWKEFKRLLVVLATGCFAKGTPVLMANGTIKAIEDIRVGDTVLAPDGSLRQVKRLARGREMMYRITPTKGEPHIVNESHMLTIALTPARKNQRVEIRDIPLREYLASHPTFKHRAKLYRPGSVEFFGQREILPLPAYFLGVYLGDGSATTHKPGRWELQKNVAITTADPEIAREVSKVAFTFGLDVRVEDNAGENKSKNLHLVGKRTGRATNGRNAVSQLIREMGINVTSAEKFIPQSYKTASIADRLELIAGLIDTDGARTNTGFDFISKSPRLAADFAFICRSVGLAAYVSPCQKSCQTGAVGDYYRVSVSGDCSGIPCRVSRKRCTPRRQIKSVLRTGFTVEPVGVGDYYGFSLCGPDGRFLLGDFTATHNTGKTVIFTRLTKLEVERGGRVLILAHAGELLDQAAEKLERSTGLVAAREKADQSASLGDQVVVASVQTLCRDSRLQGWPPDHFTLIIVDEAHRTLAKSYLKILEYFSARVLGVTATADRGDKKNLASFYEHMPFQFGLIDAVNGGWLVRPLVHEIPLTIDLKQRELGEKIVTGGDYDAGFVAHRIAPFLAQIAKHLAEQVATRAQGVVFLPSIFTASMMAEALVMNGIEANYVSGECEDRDEKIAAFKAGKLKALCNAMLLIEGFDHDAVDWICMLRPTKVRSLYAQAVGRGTRPLNGIVPALNAARTPEERRAIIAGSAKPNLKILDFLWLTDQLDLVSPYQLVAKSAAAAEQMRKNSVLMQGDLLDLEEQAERDLLASLEKAVSKNKRKKGRVIDPLEIAVKINDRDLANYEPSSRWEFGAPTADQLKLLAEYGIDDAKVKTAGLAFQLIKKAEARERLGLCTFRQMQFFERLGYQNAAFMTREEATRKQRAQLARWAEKRKPQHG